MRQDVNARSIADSWRSYAVSLAEVLQSLTCTDKTGMLLTSDEAFVQAVVQGRACQQEHTMFFIGNGASATMASHTAADLFKNAKVRTSALTDIAMITAFSNDVAYTEVFSAPIAQVMCAKDVLVAISSSGASPNIVNACEAARKKGGFIITLSAMHPENPIRSMGDLNFYVSAQTYGYAETAHAAVLHRIVDLLCATAGN